MATGGIVGTIDCVGQDSLWSKDFNRQGLLNLQKRDSSRQRSSSVVVPFGGDGRVPYQGRGRHGE